MQLFRKQALDHQNRLHGEIFLVPPLRWQAISALLLLLICGCAAFLMLGTYSRTLTATGILKSASSAEARANALHTASGKWSAILEVPIAQADAVMPGQSVSLSVDGFSSTEFGALRGTINDIGAVNTIVPKPYRSVTVAIAKSQTQQSSPMLQEGLRTQASINLGEQPLWRWLFAPILSEASRT